MPIFHVETKTDFLFFIGPDRDAVIAYVKSKNLKINSINLVDENLYNVLIKAGFINQAEQIKSNI